MGIFDFVSTAGEKIFGKDPDDNSIRQHLEGLGLGFNWLSVNFDAGSKTATLIGWVKALADKEKAIIATGNIHGVAKVDDRLKVGDRPAGNAPTAANAPQPSAAEQPAAVFYVVKAGDTLSKIAKAQYGDANKYNGIFEANKPMLKSPDKIYPGQTLRIPK